MVSVTMGESDFPAGPLCPPPFLGCGLGLERWSGRLGNRQEQLGSTEVGAGLEPVQGWLFSSCVGPPALGVWPGELGKALWCMLHLACYL